ncbi:hypothetical protein Zmor_020184 [Zophobas morio]|uniref:CRAL-TRIO domain-containing protein n=1 Tax=Zophobas morio TaxID=2755281 RepID=A0AA38I7D5_9CUCU|nr:hypothetical protein Zmor_020184 [Zophobas morio]
MAHFINVETLYSQDENLKKKEVNELIAWADQQKHLPKINEIQAILFLRRCNYQSETSKNLIDLYFTVKTLCPELFSGKNPLNSPLKEYLDVILITDLSKTTPEDYTIIFGKITSANPSEFNISLGTKYLDMVTMSTIYQKPPSKGYLFVVDLTEFTLEVLANMDLVVLKKTLFYMQKCLLLNWKGIHFFNNAPIGNRFLGMLKPFLDEFQNIIHLHDSVDDLIKYVPRDCLPENYGGLEDSVSVLQEKIKTKLGENVALFDWEEQQKVDESKRSGGPKTVNDVFGVEGTFKKLELD